MDCTNVSDDGLPGDNDQTATICREASGSEADETGIEQLALEVTIMRGSNKTDSDVMAVDEGFNVVGHVF